MNIEKIEKDGEEYLRAHIGFGDVGDKKFNVSVLLDCSGVMFEFDDGTLYKLPTIEVIKEILSVHYGETIGIDKVEEDVV